LLLRPDKQPRPAPINPLSIITAIIGFGCVLYGATITSRYGWWSPQALSALGTGVTSLVIFAIIQLRFSREPLLELRLFRDRTFLTASVVGYVAVVGLFGAEFLMPVYLQALRGRTALQSGLILLPLAIAAALINPIAGRLYDKIGPRVLVTSGALVLLLNTWQFAHLTPSTSIDRILGFLALRGVAISLIMQATFITALGAVPKRLVPRGSSLVSSTRFIAQSLGVALLATVLGNAIPQEALRPGQSQNESDARAGPVGVCEDRRHEATQASAESQQRNKACEENLHGMRQAYMVTFYAALVALLMGFWLPGWPSEWTGRDGLRQAGRDEPAQYA
jgi:DHA2 family multidrug resistance protein